MDANDLWAAVIAMGSFIGLGATAIIVYQKNKIKSMERTLSRKDKLNLRLQQEIKDILRGAFSHINGLDDEDLDDDE